jgi:hypothetical protein
VIFAAFTGWISNTLYRNNPADLILKLKYYDLSLLLIVIPISLPALLFSIRNNKRARIFTLGLTVYLIFTFGVTLFICSQNSLFLIYIAIISLCAFYLSKGGLELYNTTSLKIDRKLSKIAAVVLLFSAISGLGYWLMDAINTLQVQQEEMDLLHVNPPQVFDMAFILPFTVYGAIRLLRNKKDGILISSIAMIFFVFIGLSVVIMDIKFTAKTGIEMDYGKVYSYSFISLINIIITILVYRKLKANEIR